MTRCYAIEKTAIVAYLEEREKHPAKYAVPENWYHNRGKTRMIRQQFFVPESFDAEKAKTYYSKQLADHREVLTILEVSAICGYGNDTVLSRIHNKHLKAIALPEKHVVPKTYLLELLVSDYYNNIIIKKTKKHIDSLREIIASQE